MKRMIPYVLGLLALAGCGADGEPTPPGVSLKGTATLSVVGGNG